MTDDSRRKSKRTAFIVAGAVAALSLAVVGGVLVGRAQTVTPISLPSALTARSTPPVPKSTPRPQSPTPTPTATPQGAAVSEVPAMEPPAATPPNAAAAVPPPVARAPIAPAPVAAAPKVPRPDPTCPPDAGVLLSITNVEVIHEGAALDQYKMTVVLENRLSIPVSFQVMDGIRITSVRASGEEMPSGSVRLGEWEMEPGKRTIVTDRLTTYHGFGSPVIAFKLSGEVSVENSYPDQLSRIKYCSYRNVEMAAPFQGGWGS